MTDDQAKSELLAAVSVARGSGYPAADEAVALSVFDIVAGSSTDLQHALSAAYVATMIAAGGNAGIAFL